ncbi:hypothetical protein ACJX0J_021087, partial [Zea mays]
NNERNRVVSRHTKIQTKRLGFVVVVQSTQKKRASRNERAALLKNDEIEYGVEEAQTDRVAQIDGFDDKKIEIFFHWILSNFLYVPNQKIGRKRKERVNNKTGYSFFF